LAILGIFSLFSCSVARVQGGNEDEEQLLQETLRLVQEVKEFGRTLGIEPTEALSQSSREKPARSMLWLWMQRQGTLALRAPIDIRLALRFSVTKDELPLERLYNASGYSIYFRQGNQFGDARSVTTLDFARESLVTKVKTILHEDLHDDRNFDLPWESEESLITPLGALAAVEYFKRKGDSVNVQKAQAELTDERTLSTELNALAGEGEGLFKSEPLGAARGKLIAQLLARPTYARWFKFQLGEQQTETALEAKISHDLAYYRYYDRIVSLHEKAGDLRSLVQNLKSAPQTSDGEEMEKFLRELERQ